ncbi:cobalt ECF transporter T component CbiQ [Massilia forsythiae]|uniref:Cobalt ECF transporter T component CbiQ n=1 Tax=Massilia forsythiae TaxID=2728020 RepID=A0A7Z2VVZ6_9BURK|nr:cobalt ECF transporter T component CbiQ [Massilia forsythiae]QJE00184.1 cobalt ECF transporter T component CbiQ [Massilia forsythiae]
MRVESAAYACRWRGVAPSAKALFALAGVVSAWIARSPAVLAALAALLVLAAVAGARVPLRTYLAVALPPLGFLLLSCLTMLVTPGVAAPGVATPGADGGWHWTAALLPVVTRTALRALAVLAALLGLVLSTPLPDLIGLLRRLRTPELLLDLMVLCYRMLFVFRQAWDEGVTAQRARLGYRSWRHAWRSMGLLIGQMAVQVWQRTAALQTAAEARALQGSLRFLPAVFPQAPRQNAYAVLAGSVLLALAVGDRL